MDLLSPTQKFGVLCGFLTFIGGWVYAISAWGWFLGISLGWIPAAILGVMVFFVWPVIAFIIAAIIIFAWFASR